jgi:hypothetical protein
MLPGASVPGCGTCLQPGCQAVGVVRVFASGLVEWEGFTEQELMHTLHARDYVPCDHVV